jgi:hypothetical protein
VTGIEFQALETETIEVQDPIPHAVVAFPQETGYPLDRPALRRKRDGVQAVPIAGIPSPAHLAGQKVSLPSLERTDKDRRTGHVRLLLERPTRPVSAKGCSYLIVLRKAA